MGGAIDWMWRDEARCTPWMAYQFDRINADLQRLFNVRLYGTSGVRLEHEQEYLFKLRYRIASQVNGRKVYDTRIWNGVRWYRIDPTGTVAVPRTSNHEIQGQSAAFDLRDTGSDAGITDRNSVRGRWFRAHCHEYGMQAEGDNFREGWHFKVLGVFRTPPSTPAYVPTISEEDDMYDDGKHREVLTAARPVKLYKMGSGIVAVGDEGGFWVIPSEAYLNLLIAWEIAGPNLVNRPIDQNELTVMRGILGATSNSATAARVEAVLNLTPEDAERLAAAVGRQPVVLSEETLGEIARAAAEGAREGGADGAAAAISGLSFVTTIS